MAGVEPGGAAPPPVSHARVPSVAGDIAAVPDSIVLLRHVVTAFAGANGATGKQLGDIALVVSEAVSNVVMHAYDGDGLVHLSADIEDGSLEIVVADDGLGFRGGESDGLGIGLDVIAELTSDFAITPRDPHGTELWVRFLLDA